LDGRRRAFKRSAKYLGKTLLKKDPFKKGFYLGKVLPCPKGLLGKKEPKVILKKTFYKAPPSLILKNY